MVTTLSMPPLVEEKLAAFERLRPEFEASFTFVQDVHGQQRFESFPVAQTVRYLHALWICECKDRLLSIPKTIERYEGRYCLKLLRGWQEGYTADVVDFLQRKLDTMPFADLTQQIHEARHGQQNEGLARRLLRGRMILLNRGMNLMHALDAIFAPDDEELLSQVRAACERYGHRPEQIEQQLAEIASEIYTFMPHRALAQRNMVVMNRLGVDVTKRPGDEPGQRSWRVLEPTMPPGPYAQQVIAGYQELTAPWHNALRAPRFVDRPENSESGTM